MNNTFPTEGNLSGLSRKDFQKEINNKETDLFILTNDNGAEMAITNYGGAILAIMVPDKNGKLANVVQGHDNIESVINSPEVFLSTLIGRYGNRIQTYNQQWSEFTSRRTNWLPCTRLGCSANKQTKCNTSLSFRGWRRRIPRQP